jgi:site-specific recombinase XerD
LLNHLIRQEFAMAEISPLRRRMIDDMMIRNLSPTTQQSYLYAVAKFSRHFGRSSDRLDLEEVRAYQLHLIAQQRSWSHINQTVCALRFFYGVTLGRTDALERIVAAREPQKLLVVLSAEEIVQFLEAVPGLRNRAALTTAYGAGLRVGEVARLTIGAIDSRRMLIRVEQGRAAKIVMSCCRRSCCRSCAPTGGWRGRAAACSPVGRRASRLASPHCRRPAGWRRGVPNSVSR